MCTWDSIKFLNPKQKYSITSHFILFLLVIVTVKEPLGHVDVVKAKQLCKLFSGVEL